jgi:PPOX class probable F420-dependent enzyme
MTQAEVDELLDRQRTVTLATIGPDGRPHLASMWFGRDGQDLLMWTYRTSQKARNVERDPRVSVIAETGDSYDQLRGACLDCAVKVVRDEAEVLELGRRVHERNSASAPGDDIVAVDAGLRVQAAKRIGLRLRVERVRSWDHRKLRAGAR